MNKELKRGIRKRKKLWMIGLAVVMSLVVTMLGAAVGSKNNEDLLVVLGMAVFFVPCLIWLIGRVKTSKADKPIRDFLYRLDEKELPDEFCLPLWAYDGSVNQLKRFAQRGIAVLLYRPKGIYRLISAIDEEKRLFVLSTTGKIESTSVLKEDSAYQHLLEKLVLRTRDASIRRKALEDITDQSILTELTKKWYPELAGRIEDQNVLAELAIEGNLAAVKAITDGHLLAEVAKEATQTEIGREAVRAITDQRLLAEVAKKATIAGEEAAKAITDQCLLAEIISDRNIAFFTREKALNNLNDRPLLKEIAEQNDSLELRWAAAQKLKEPDLISVLKPEYDQWKKEEEERIERKKKEKIQKKLDDLYRTNYAAYLDYLYMVDPDAWHEQTENRV